MQVKNHQINSFLPLLSNTCGIGLKSIHYHEIITTLPKVDLIEIHSENFFTFNSKLHENFEIIAANYNLSFHCTSMSLGSTDPLNKVYLKRLKELVDIYKPNLISDHLAWSSVEGVYLHDLLPLPYTLESYELFKSKINIAQDYLNQQILIENPSLYLSFQDSTWQETDFLNKLTKETGCAILLDINNIFVSSTNLSYDPISYIDNIDSSVVKQLHLANYQENPNGILIDTHSGAPCKSVMALFEYFVKKYGARPTIFEQDQNLDSLSSLLTQAYYINKILAKDGSLCS